MTQNAVDTKILPLKIENRIATPEKLDYKLSQKTIQGIPEILRTFEVPISP